MKNEAKDVFGLTLIIVVIALILTPFLPMHVLALIVGTCGVLWGYYSPFKGRDE